ncbi:MFS transporter [Halalkalibacillus halophilus]|uniref:MFS transporter n=1 Tax=Halalkalibacillus halophilus TaxID=392827 RepID=UPI00040ED2D9|nr:MFS transporter [Halalkalibacillus halophilus]
MTDQSSELQPIIKNKRFILFFITFLASSLSVSFFLFTVNWYVVDGLELEAMLGLVFFASSVPRLVFMLLGGAIADRVNKASIMFLSDFTKALLLIGVVILLIVGVLNIWVLVGLAFLFGLLDAFFWPASNSLFPSLVDRSQLTRANSIIQTTQRFSVIIGPVIAGAVIGFGSYEVMFGLVSLMLLVAAVVDVYLKRATTIEVMDEEEPSTVWQSITSGFRYVKESPFLLTLMMTSVSINLFISGPLQVGLPIFARNILDGDEFTYSILSGTSGVGMLIGSVTIGILNVRNKRGVVAIVGIVFLSIFFVAFSLSGVLWLSMLFVGLIGITLSVIDIPLISAIQAHTEEKFIGRIMSLLAFASIGLVPVSYLLTTSFISLGFDINEIMLVSSLCLLVVGFTVLLFAKSLRTID